MRTPVYSLPDGFALQRLGHDTGVEVDDVLAFWAAHGAVTRVEASRRVHEVLFVATDPDEALVGVTTVFLRHHRRLRMDLWHFRVFVADEHRLAHVSAALGLNCLLFQIDQYASGADRRAPGWATEVTIAEVRRTWNDAVWPYDAYFMGENEAGDHLRVVFFAGAQVPVAASSGRR